MPHYIRKDYPRQADNPKQMAGEPEYYNLTPEQGRSFRICPPGKGGSDGEIPAENENTQEQISRVYRFLLRWQKSYLTMRD